MFFLRHHCLGCCPNNLGGGGVLGDNHAGLSASATASEALTAQEQLLAGTLEFDPENDPVVYTTDYGLDIKWHMAGLPANAGDIAMLIDGKFTGYAYINYAGYNWAIIGYSNKSTSLSSGKYVNIANIVSYYTQFSGYNSNSIWQWIQAEVASPAKTAIYNDIVNGKNDLIYNLSSTNMKMISSLFPNAKPVSELEGNEVLCFCQTNIGTSTFNNDASSGHKYSNSQLRTNLNSFYNNKLTSLPIVAKPLSTTYWDTSTNSAKQDTSISAAYIFPLAGQSASESFYWGSYLTAGSGGNMDIDVPWWLRSGRITGYQDPTANAYSVTTDGAVYEVNGNADGVVRDYFCMRPAFVLQI